MARQLAAPEVRFAETKAMLTKFLPQIAAALPRHLTPERMLRTTLTAISRSPKLLECSPRSLLGAIVQASQLGLEPDDGRGFAYLVPFYNGKTKQFECQLIPGYKGLLDLARRSGTVSTAVANTVHERDEFTFSYGMEPTLNHKPRLRERGPAVAYYALVFLKDADAVPHMAVLSREEVDEVRARSKAADSGPWVTDYDRMGEKTALKRALRLCPLSVEATTAIALDDAAERGVSQDLAGVFVSDSPEPPVVVAPAEPPPAKPAADPVAATPAQEAEVTSMVEDLRKAMATGSEVARAAEKLRIQLQPDLRLIGWDRLRALYAETFGRS